MLVLPVPGKSSSSRCPSETRQVSARRTTCCLPNTAWPMFAARRVNTSANHAAWSGVISVKSYLSLPPGILGVAVATTVRSHGIVIAVVERLVARVVAVAAGVHRVVAHVALAGRDVAAHVLVRAEVVERDVDVPAVPARTVGQDSRLGTTADRRGRRVGWRRVQLLLVRRGRAVQSLLGAVDGADDPYLDRAARPTGIRT